MKKTVMVIILLATQVYAANTKVTDLNENTTVADADVLYIIDAGTTSEKITVLNLFDTIDTFAELNTIVTIKTLVNEEDAAAWDALATFNLGLTITTGDPLTLGVVRWDDGSDQIDGEQIADDTIDNDSIDWGDMTDLGTDGIVSADSVALTTDTTGNYSTGNAEGGDALVAVAVEISDNDATAENNPIVFVAGAEAAGGDLPLETDSDVHYNPSTGTITATEFVGGGAGLTGTLTGYNSIADPGASGSISFDDGETATYTGANDGAVSFFTIQNSDADHTVGALYLLDLDYSADDGDAEGDFIKCQDSGGIVFTIQQNGDTVSTGTLQGTTITATTGFSGDGSSLTAVDAATGDSATDFFDAGTIEHEWGGLQANVSGYTGLIGITGVDTTVEVDLLSELLTAMGDVTAFITDDDVPAAGTDPDVDAAGEIGRDTDAAGETNDSSLRGFDNAAQFLYAKKLKTLSFTLISPDTIDAADLIPIWHNTSGMTFTITEWKAWSDDDNVSLEIEELTSQTDYTAITTVDAVEIATDGTGVYYASDSTITHAAIEHDHSLAIDFDTTDTPDYVQISITGWFNSDVAP